MQIIVALSLLTAASAFVAPRPVIKSSRLHENFFLDIAEDPAINTPKPIFGEESYIKFVTEFDPDALRGDAIRYDLIARVRELKLLKATAESGLLEALEAKGLTLSQVEKLLPLIDQLGVLPLLAKNKDLVLKVAPLVVEPAGALLPVIVSLLRTPSSNILLPGAAFIAAGGYEVIFDNGLLGIPLVLLGAPLVVLGSLLGAEISVPTVSASATVAEPARPASSRPTVASKAPKVAAAPKVVAAAPKFAAAPKVVAAAPNKVAAPSPKISAAPKIAVKATSAAGSQNGRRKTVKIR